MGLHTKVEIKKECKEIHGIDGAFKKAIEFLDKQYKLYECIDPEKTITISMELGVTKNDN